MIDLSIILVNYNGGPLLVQTLESLEKAGIQLDYAVSIVDNASNDGSLEAARAAMPAARIIENAENVGFARACNVGIRGLEAKHYLLLNSDTEVPAGAIERVWHFLDETEGAGVAAPAVVYPDGRDQRTARMFPTPANALFGRHSIATRLFPNNRFSRRYMPESGDESYSVVDWVSGAALMIRHEVVSQIGLMDEHYFMYWEDADWCFRAKQAGWKTYCVKDVQIVHHEGGSSLSVPSMLVIEFHKSIFHFYAKNYLGGRRGLAYFAAGTALLLRAAGLLALGWASAAGGGLQSWVRESLSSRHSTGRHGARAEADDPRGPRGPRGEDPSGPGTRGEGAGGEGARSEGAGGERAAGESASRVGRDGAGQ